MQTPEKKVIKQRTKKAIVTQDNRFIYAKYNMEDEPDKEVNFQQEFEDEDFADFIIDEEE